MRQNYPETHMAAQATESVAAPTVHESDDKFANQHCLGRTMHGRLYDLGIIDVDLAKPLDGEMWWTDVRFARPARTNGPAFNTYVATFNDELHFCTTTCNEVMGTTNAGMIADETMKNLARMAAGDWPLVDTPTPALKGGCVVC
jgi:hypothetical protein